MELNQGFFITRYFNAYPTELTPWNRLNRSCCLVFSESRRKEKGHQSIKIHFGKEEVRNMGGHPKSTFFKHKWRDCPQWHIIISVKRLVPRCYHTFLGPELSEMCAENMI